MGSPVKQLVPHICWKRDKYIRIPETWSFVQEVEAPPPLGDVPDAYSIDAVSPNGVPVRSTVADCTLFNGPH